MKRRMVLAFVILSGGAFLVGGCANKETVKNDEALAPPAVVQSKQANEKTAKPETGNASATPVAQPAQTKNETAATNAVQLHNALEKIYFDFDSYGLSDQARTTLVKNVDMLRHNSAVKVRVEGNCDERGSSEYNLALGERRARAAKQYMTTMGIPEQQLSIISYGKEKPADPGHNEAAWAKNRRDEFVITSK